MRCQNQFTCSGHYCLRMHMPTCPLWLGDKCKCVVRSEVFVDGHRLPVWVQCNACGVSPLREHQGMVIRQVLMEACAILDVESEL